MLVTANVRWLRSEEGGRSNVPSGPEYRSTAVFSDLSAHHGADEEHVSITLLFDEGSASADEAHQVQLHTVVPDLLGMYFGDIGRRFLVMEGHRPVAVAEVTSVEGHS